MGGRAYVPGNVSSLFVSRPPLNDDRRVLANAHRLLLLSNGHEYAKTVVDPIRQVVPRSALRGLLDEYRHIEADVLLIEGELHLNRKPVRNYALDFIEYPYKRHSFFLGIPAFHIFLRAFGLCFHSSRPHATSRCGVSTCGVAR